MDRRKVMIRWQLKFGIPLTLAMACLIGPGSVRSADKTVAKSSKVVRPKAQTRPVPAKSASEIVPASFSSVTELQDSTVDQCEEVRDRARVRASRLYRECLIARCQRYESEKIRLEHENCKDWFNYIRGYGPVVWVRN
jgi:hypothetical protein